MEHRISATELATRLDGVLDAIRYRAVSYTVEENGRALARIGPVAGARPMAIREFLSFWEGLGPADKGFADALEHLSQSE